jgi:glycosylphosphatidylinositol transamidase (GPIT) subunit GPI8
MIQLIVKTCINIIDVFSYSDLRAMKNTGGKKHLTLYALEYRVIDSHIDKKAMVNGENIRIDGGAHAGAKW